MRLSILIPSNRPEEREKFIESIQKNSVTNDVELVFLVDDEVDYTEKLHDNLIVIHQRPKKPLCMSELNYECYKACTGDWIMLGNDDTICNTPEWDKQLFIAIEQFGQDGIALFWPDDCMFGSKLACFPIVSRKLLELINFFPLPYRRYKIDDTLFNIIPTSKRYFLSNIEFKHSNDQGRDGFQLGDGRTYPIDREAGSFDNEMWIAESGRRNKMRKTILSTIGISIRRVLVAVLTQEMGRRADFYDNLDFLQVPDGCEIISTKVHAQSPAKARNVLIERAIDHDCSHIFFLDDDVYPQPDALKRLMSHDKDMVTGLYLARNYPHRPYIFDNGPRPDMSHAWRALRKNESGLVEITNAGLGVSLIKTEVFLAMERPWVRLGEYELDNWCDDIGFFNRATAAGFKLYVDLDCHCGHSASIVIWPEYTKDGEWLSTYWTSSNEGRPTIPQPGPIIPDALQSIFPDIGPSGGRLVGVKDDID